MKPVNIFLKHIIVLKSNFAKSLDQTVKAFILEQRRYPINNTINNTCYRTIHDHRPCDDEHLRRHTEDKALCLCPVRTHLFLQTESLDFIKIFIYNLTKQEVSAIMKVEELLDSLECNPVIAAVLQENLHAALDSPVSIIFHLGINLIDVEKVIAQVHNAGKYIFIHLDLAEGIGKDRTGVRYLAQCGADGIISTKSQLIRYAKEQGLITVQRFFALDSKGMDSIEEMAKNANPHIMEIMPGVIDKAIRRFSSCNIPVIAGGLIQTKTEVTDALNCGATAVSTGKADLWHL